MVQQLGQVGPRSSIAWVCGPPGFADAEQDQGQGLSRYQRYGSKAASELFKAVNDRTHGVMAWDKTALVSEGRCSDISTSRMATSTGFRNLHISRRPSIAFEIVTSSANSRSL